MAHGEPWLEDFEQQVDIGSYTTNTGTVYYPSATYTSPTYYYPSYSMGAYQPSVLWHKAPGAYGWNNPFDEEAIDLDRETVSSLPAALLKLLAKRKLLGADLSLLELIWRISTVDPLQNIIQDIEIHFSLGKEVLSTTITAEEFMSIFKSGYNENVITYQHPKNPLDQYSLGTILLAFSTETDRDSFCSAVLL